MKTRRLRLTLYLAVFLSWQIPSQAQWVQTNGPYGGSVNCFAVIGTSLFTGTRCGVFISTDNGTSWTQSGLRNTKVLSFAVIGSNLFAGTEWEGVFLSTDSGTSWTEVNTGLGAGAATVNAFTVSGTSLFAGINGWYDYCVFLSTNNGASWTATGLIGKVSGYVDVQALAVIGSNLFAGTDGGLFLSTNNGASWRAVNNGLENAYGINALAVNGSNLFASTGGGVFLSTNNGTSWSPAGTPFSSFSQMVESGTNLFAGTGAGVFLSTNNGTSWTAAGLTNVDVLSFAVSGSNLFAGTTNQGVFRSTDNGTSWTAVNTGLIANAVGALAVNGTNLFASILFDCCGGEVFMSTDDGTSWSPAGTPFSVFSQMIKKGTKLFAGTGDGVFLSTDNGTSWTAAGLTDVNVYSFTVNDTNFFAGTDWGGVFLSTDSGISWTDVSTGVTACVSALAVIGTNLFAGCWNPFDWGTGVFLSTDNGRSWRAVGTPFSGFSKMIKKGTKLFTGTGDGVFLSTDNGSSWTQTGLTNTAVHSFILIGTYLFAGTDNGVFLSTDNGTSWAPIGLTNNTVGALAENGSNLFAVTGCNGVWRRPLSEMTSVEEPLADRRLPENFSLEQNYPNPFNPTTSIRYQLSVVSHVTLKVYNSAGREVACLVDRQMPAGNHSTEWNAYGVPSGIYFYRIQAGTYSETKKLVLMR